VEFSGTLSKLGVAGEKSLLVNFCGIKIIPCDSEITLFEVIIPGFQDHGTMVGSS
jgi:hypothetical protein